MILFFRILTLFVYLSPTLIYAQSHKVAIVIDDIGYRLTDAGALTLPGKITFAILPHTPFGKRLAEQAHANSKDVLLHIPMESNIGKKLGPGALTTDMNEQQIQHSLALSFAEIPFAIGINNHMGSKLTQLIQPMTSTMRYLKKHNLIFLDSKTTSLSKGQEVAKALGVPTLHRHIFLDNQLSETYIRGQFKQLINTAKKNNGAVAIAHPHPESIKILKKLLPTLKQHNIELVPLSALLEQQVLKLAATTAP